MNHHDLQVEECYDLDFARLGQGTEEDHDAEGGLTSNLPGAIFKPQINVMPPQTQQAEGHSLPVSSSEKQRVPWMHSFWRSPCSRGW